jgi:hypothetical protein
MGGVRIVAATTLAPALLAAAGKAPAAEKREALVRGCVTRAEGDGPIRVRGKSSLLIGPVKPGCS